MFLESDRKLEEDEEGESEEASEALALLDEIVTEDTPEVEYFWSCEELVEDGEDEREIPLSTSRSFEDSFFFFLFLPFPLSWVMLSDFIGVKPLPLPPPASPPPKAPRKPVPPVFASCGGVAAGFSTLMAK